MGTGKAETCGRCGAWCWTPGNGGSRAKYLHEPPGRAILLCGRCVDDCRRDDPDDARAWVAAGARGGVRR
jgi:hypothetical protein